MRGEEAERLVDLNTPLDFLGDVSRDRRCLGGEQVAQPAMAPGDDIVKTGRIATDKRPLGEVTVAGHEMKAYQLVASSSAVEHVARVIAMRNLAEAAADEVESDIVQFRDDDRGDAALLEERTDQDRDRGGQRQAALRQARRATQERRGA